MGRGPTASHIARVRTPLGVIGVIFESRPNVTADAGALMPQVGQRRDPARRLGQRPLHRAPSTPACVEGLRAAGLPARCDPARADHRPRRRRRNAARARRQYRRHRAARRQDPGRARAGRGARAGLCPSRGPLPHLYRQVADLDMAVDVTRQRQDAPHRHLRRRRDAAGPQGRGRDPSQADHRRADRQAAAKSAAMPRCSAADPDGACRRPRRTGTPNTRTPSSR